MFKTKSARQAELDAAEARKAEKQAAREARRAAKKRK